MKSPQLKFDGRRCVLEQALKAGNSPGRVGREYAKILLASKSFLSESKTWQIYSFVVSIGRRVRFLFEDFSPRRYKLSANRLISLTVEKARNVMKLLNPRFAAFYVNTGNQTYLQLLDLAEGKLALYFHRDFDFAQDLIDQYWPRLYGLACSANRITNLPQKEFNRLVVDVRNTNEMRSVMRHDTKFLELLLPGEFLGEVEEFQEVGKIQKCNVGFYFIAWDDGLSTYIRNARLNCKDVKSLIIQSKGEFSNAELVGLVGILFAVEETYRIYSQVVTEFLDSPVKTNIEVQVKFVGNNFMLPVNWMAPLLANERFRAVRHQTTIVENNVTAVFSNEQAHNNLKAKLSTEVHYQLATVQLVNEDAQLDDQ